MDLFANECEESTVCVAFVSNPMFVIRFLLGMIDNP